MHSHEKLWLTEWELMMEGVLFGRNIITAWHKIVKKMSWKIE